MQRQFEEWLQKQGLAEKTKSGKSGTVATYINAINKIKRGTNHQIKDFNLKDSQKDVLLQVADVITGSIAWGYKNHNHLYKKAISRDKIDIWEFR